MKKIKIKKADDAPPVEAAQESPEQKANRLEAESLANAHAEIQSDHSKAHPAYMLSEIRKMQKGKK